ncbi:tetratricopeptide repeat protein [Pseudooceanicola nanhaiensis]|uniref:tetratricopeptide repeat protein n=1 Tax=Pseudooceanicola nanhaiensis TaxID=375761 RepID=UPI0035173918
MSQSDSFIEEVTEEVRRDRLFATMKRFGWIAIVLVLLIVGGAAYNEYRKSQERASAEALGDALLNALDQDAAEERVAALNAVETDSAGQEAVVALLEASEAASAGDPAKASDRLMAVAEREDLPRIYRDLARFKALGMNAAAMEPAELRAGYEALAAPGAPLRLLALEQVALTYVAEGDTEQAVEVLESVRSDAEVTSGLRQRVSQLMVALGEDPAAEDTAEPVND